MLDHLLAILLLLVFPARALWRSRCGRIASETKIARYTTTVGMVAGMLALLTSIWLIKGRSSSELGLNAPTTAPSLVGLGVSVVILAALTLSKPKMSAPSGADVQAARREIMPETTGEIRLFLLLCLAVGCGWEILYRGFLLMYLHPITGLSGAVIISALAYGAAHGFKTVKQFVASIVSALAFTIGYAMTSNLWWLMLLHTGLMVLGALASRALSREAVHG